MSVRCVHKRKDRYWCESTETKERVRHFHDNYSPTLTSVIKGECSTVRATLLT
jgi:hypothetical protein